MYGKGAKVEKQEYVNHVAKRLGTGLGKIIKTVVLKVIKLVGNRMKV